VIDECLEGRVSPEWGSLWNRTAKPHRGHFKEWEGAPLQSEEEDLLMHKEASKRDINLRERCANHIKLQPLERWGEADPDTRPWAVRAPCPVCVLCLPGCQNLTVRPLQTTRQ